MEKNYYMSETSMLDIIKAETVEAKQAILKIIELDKESPDQVKELLANTVKMIIWTQQTLKPFEYQHWLECLKNKLKKC